MRTHSLRHRAKSALLSATLATSVLVPLSATPALAATNGGRITGNIGSDGVQPTSGDARVCVSAFNLAGNWVKTVVTEDGPDIPADFTGAYRGDFEITGLEPGSYKLRAVDCGDNNLGGSGNPALETLWFPDTGAAFARTFDEAGAYTVTAENANGKGSGLSAGTLSPSSDYTISGSVQEDVTGILLDGICVRVYDAVTGTPVAETTTQSGIGIGNYSVTGLTEGTYKVGFSDDDPTCGAHTRIQGTVGVTGTPPASVSDTRAGEKANFSHASEFWSDQTTLGSAGLIALNDETGDATGINANLAKVVATNGISGRISAEPSGTAAGICVSAYRTDGTRAAQRTTNASGDYSMALAPGSYTIEAHERCVGDIGIAKDNYVAEFHGNVAVPDDQAPSAIDHSDRPLPSGVSFVTVSSASFTTVSFAIARRGSISGVVTDESSPTKPLQDVCVVALDGANAVTDPSPSAVTDASGNYSLSNLRPATYVVEFRATDPATGECGQDAHAADDNDPNTTNGYLSEYWNGADAKASATPVTVTAGQSRTGIGASLRSSGDVKSISGTVTRAGTSPAAPIEGVCVIAQDLDRKVVDAALTASDGTYTIDAVPSGQYKVKFTTAEACDTNGDGTPEKAAVTDPTSTNYLGTKFHSNATHVGAATTVTVSTANVNNVNASLARGSRIQGSVSGLQNTGDEVCVEVLDENQNVVQSRKIGNASFTFDGLVPGRFVVRADDRDPQGTCHGLDYSDGDDGYRVEYFLDKATFTDATPIDLATGGTRTSVTLTMVKVGAAAGNFSRVYGYVFDPDLNGDSSNQDGGNNDDQIPLPNVRVELFRLDQNPETDTAAFSATTNELGFWEIKDKAAGTYKVRFTDTTGIHATEWHRGRRSFAEANGLALDQSAEIEVIESSFFTSESGTRTQRTGTVLAQAGNITGRVSVESDSTPIVGATVRALGEESGNVIATATTGADGRYTVKGLAAGGYKVQFVPADPNLTSEFWDDQLTLATATVVTVQPTETRSAINAQLKKNNPPVAGDDNVQAEVNKSTTFNDLTANDVDPDGDPVSIVSVGEASHGTVALNSDGTVTYTPAQNNQDDATFPYTIADSRGLKDTATVTVEIVGEIIGAPPVANDDQVTIPADTATTIDVLANDTDSDGSVPPTLTSVTTPFHGTAVIQNGKVLYTPDTGFSGIDQFSYTITDDQGYTDNAKVTVTVQGQGNVEKTGSVGAGGTVKTDGSTASPSNPIITSVTTPNAGTITIKEEQIASGAKVSDITLVNWRSVVTAPNASASNPLVITFRLDGSLLQGEQPARALRVLRNNTLVGDCLGGTVASPDPCISGHRMDGDDLVVTIRTSAASNWNFGFDDDAVVDRATGAAGTGRVGTAVAVSRNAFDPADVDTVVIARKDAYPDALAGAPLAHQLGAPMLLTTKDTLDTITRDEIVRLGASRVVILGGTAAVSTGVESSLRSIPGVTQVDRIRGADRYATAAAIAQQLGSYDLAYVVEGADADLARGWPDAVAVASLAAFEGRPILLVTTEELPAATRNALQGLPDAAIIGGTASVSTNVANAIDQVVGSVARVRGSDRYETSFAVAQRAVNAGMSASSVWVATGLNFPDALAAGPAVAKEGGILLLVNGKDYDASPAVERFLTQNRAKVESLTITGGTAAVSVGAEVRMAQATQN